MDGQADYHRKRAENELSLGLTARSIAAARAHLQLASLHRERLRALVGHSEGPKPPLVMS